LNLKKYANNTAILLLALILICSALLIPSLGFKYGQTGAGADYAVLEGVAGSDYYDSMQYSYQVNQWAYENGLLQSFTPDDVYYNASKSLRIGLTEYGEIATPANAGIAYGANATEWANSESWSSTGVNPKYWIQGWVFYLNYTRQGIIRALEGYALYSDLTTVEGARKVYSWFGQYNPDEVPAHLTGNGTLIPSGVKILYDSARLAIARSATIIHDGYYDEDVAEVFVTIVFNKDTKYAIVYKDVKMLLDPKVLDFIGDFAFSERYELDIARGINPGNTAYAEYYPNNITSVYQDPLTGQYNADIVQAFNPDEDYTFFAGYWPNTTEHTLYAPLIPDLPNGYTRVLAPGTSVNDIPDPPVGPGEPSTPWVIAQWRYNSTDWPNLLSWFAKSANRQMRFVEVAGMTDFNSDPHPAGDTDAGDPATQVDTEILYMLNQVFNPEDLNSLAGTAFTGDYPFMWTGLGQSAATTDSGGAGLVGGNGYGYWATSFTLFDRNDTMFPYIAPVVGMKGTIPYGLNSYGGNYYQSFSNSGTGAGTDTTTFKRTGLNGFVFGTYDDVIDYPPQPIAGGWSNRTSLDQGEFYDEMYWYPSKDPLTERWVYDITDDAWTISGYDAVTYDPNGILSLGGMKANGLTRYFNDFDFAISREGTAAYALINGGSVTGSAPTSDPAVGTYDWFPVSSWAVNKATFGYKDGYAVISLARDINGTRGLSIYGWDGRDTFWAAAWASQYIIGSTTGWLPDGAVAIILKMTYTDGSHEPTLFTVVKALGTITEFGDNDFIDVHTSFDNGASALPWTGAIDVPSYPEGWGIDGGTPVWWWGKLSTTSTAAIEFDP
jgi:hypothetical protein